MTLSRRQLFATLAAPLVAPLAELVPSEPGCNCCCDVAPSETVVVFDNFDGTRSECSWVPVVGPWRIVPGSVEEP